MQFSNKYVCPHVQYLTDCLNSYMTAVCSLVYGYAKEKKWMLKMALWILLPTLISIKWVPVNNLSQISCTVQLQDFPVKCVQFQNYNFHEISW